MSEDNYKCGFVKVRRNVEELLNSQGKTENV